MRIYITHEPWPHPQAVVDAARTAGASQIVTDLNQAEGVQGIEEVDPVPPIVSMMQAELALIGVGKLDAVRAVVNAGDEATKSYWNRAYEIHRDHPLTNAIGAAVGLNSAAMDTLFRAAKAIK